MKRGIENEGKQEKWKGRGKRRKTKKRQRGKEPNTLRGGNKAKLNIQCLAIINNGEKWQFSGAMLLDRMWN